MRDLLFPNLSIAANISGGPAWAVPVSITQLLPYFGLPPSGPFTAGNILVANGSAWVSVPMTGDVTITAAGLTSVNQAHLTDQAAPSAPASGTLILRSFNQQGFSVPHVYDTQGNAIEITRDNITVVRNITGSTIAKGTPVYRTGSTGTVSTVAPAKADSGTTMPAIGIMYDTTVSPGYGRAMYLGHVENLNLSAFSNGDALYVSAASAGVLTNIAPATFPQFMGTVINNGVGNGVLSVHPQEAPQVDWNYSGYTAKTTPVGADLVVIADSAASNQLKKVTLTNFVKGTSPLTTKGDLFTYSTINDRLPIGSDNSVLVADSTASTGNKWTSALTASHLLGMGTSGGAAPISLGTALSMSGTTLNAGTQPIPNGTSNPGSPSTNDLFWRTDLGFFIYYDGTRWLTFNEYASNIYGYSATLPLAATLQGAFRWGTRSDYSAFMTRFQITTLINGGTSNSTNKWTANMVQYNAANAAIVTTAVLDTSTGPDTVSTWVTHDVVLNTPENASTKQLQLDFTKTGNPGNLFLVTTMYYRLIIT